MENAQHTHYVPNSIARIILTAMEEILGRNGLNAILNTSGQPALIHNLPPGNMEKEFPFENISKLNIALEDVYGTLGGRGLAIRIGRASFKYGLREAPESWQTCSIAAVMRKWSWERTSTIFTGISIPVPFAGKGKPASRYVTWL
jgi:hypothetical protein